MHTATLKFELEQLHIISGIKVCRKDDLENIHVYADSKRMLVLPITIEDPPLIIHRGETEDEMLYYLSRLSLVSDGRGGLFASREVGDKEKMLLLIDTRDEGAPLRNSGEYTISRMHDVRLPSKRTSRRLGEAKFGMIVCVPSESYFVRSTSGHVAKLTLGADGVFSCSPCDGRKVSFSG